MKNQRRFKDQQLFCGPQQPAKTNSNHTNNHNGGSDTDNSQSTIRKSNTQTIIAASPQRDGVAALAYQIYLREGCPQGRNLQHWLAAEAQLADVPTTTIKTEMTVKTETTVKNEIGPSAKTDKARALLVA